MTNNNICKFVSESYEDTLTTTRFIFESAVPPEGYRDVLSSDAVYLVAAGSGRLTVAGKAQTVGAGDLIFAFPGQEIFIEDLGGLQYMYIWFSGGRAAKLYARYGVSAANALFHGMEGLTPLWKDSLVRADERNLDLLSESMLLYAFSRLSSEARQDEEMIRDFTVYIEAHFRESDCSLAGTAAALGYNEKYLSHRLKQKLKMNFSDYLRNRRLQYAVLLFGEGVTSVKNVAILTGFTDPYYFSKIFKQSLGYSPREYIRRVGG